MTPPPLDADLLASHFALGSAHAPLAFAARGQNNLLGLWRLSTPTGIFAVKCYQTEPDDNAIAIERAAHAAGLALPQPMPDRAGRYCTPARDWNPAVGWLRVFEWIDGQALDWGATSPAQAHTVGGLMAQIHQLAAPRAVLVNPPYAPLDHAGWHALLERATLREIPWAAALQQAVPMLLREEAFVISQRPDVAGWVPSQRDYHPPNVMETPSGALLLVDWDAAGPALPNEDVAGFAHYWSPHAFIRGYRDAGGQFAPGGVRDFASSVQAFLSWLRFNLERDVQQTGATDPVLSHALLLAVPDFDLPALEARARGIAGS